MASRGGAPQRLRCPNARHRGDLPGADGLPRPLGRREHLHRPSRPGRARQSAPDAREADAVLARLVCSIDVIAGTRPDTGRATDRGDRQGPLAQRPRPDHGRADGLAVGARGAAALRIVERLRRQGVAIMFICHRLEEVFEIADRVTVLRDGSWISTGRAEPTPERDPRDGRPRRGRVLRADAGMQPGEVVLRSEGWAARACSRTSSFDVRAGEVLGLRRPRRCASHRRRPGAVRHRAGQQPAHPLDGQPSRSATPRTRWRTGSPITEDRRGLGLVLPMSITSNITLPTLRPLSRPPGLVRQQRRAARGYPGPADDPRAVRRRAGGQPCRAAISRRWC